MLSTVHTWGGYDSLTATFLLFLGDFVILLLVAAFLRAARRLDALSSLEARDMAILRRLKMEEIAIRVEDSRVRLEGKFDERERAEERRREKAVKEGRIPPSDIVLLVGTSPWLWLRAPDFERGVCFRWPAFQVWLVCHGHSRRQSGSRHDNLQGEFAGFP